MYQTTYYFRYAISIHAPRAGGDKDKAYDNATTAEISIHAPRAGGDMAERRKDGQ